MADSGAVAELRIVLVSLDEKCGELAEVRKAELDARHNALTNGARNITEARENASIAAAEYTKEAIDLQMDIDSLLRWKEYWTLLANRGD